MALYEHVYLARQDVTAQQVEALTEQMKSMIEAAAAGRQDRVLGREDARLPHQEEPQGPFLPAEHRALRRPQ